MRILLLTHVYPPSIGGVQRSVANLARLLSARGHEVSVATHHPWGLVLPASRRDGIEVLRLRVPSPFRFHRWSAAPWLDRFNRWRLERWCRRRGVQLIHAHLINADTRYAFDVADRTGAKVVITLRGGETAHWLTPHPHRAEYVKDVLERADHVTAVAAALLDEAGSLSPGLEGRSSTVPNPVEPARLLELSNTVKDRAARREPYLLFVGRLESMKGVATLIDAHHLLGAGGHPTPVLTIVGSGSLEAELEERARHGPGGSTIRFIGPCDHAATLGLIREAAALILPSETSEGCPNAVLEAMALGTPVIVSDLPALQELVADGAAGAVFARSDPSALRDCIVGVLTDSDARERRIIQARERLATHHRPEAVITRYEEIYERLVAGPPTPSARITSS